MGADRGLGFVVFYNHQAVRCGLLREVVGYLEAKAIVVDAFLIDNSEDLVLSAGRYTHGVALGGDGTTLRASLLVEALSIPLLAIHVGTLGFLASHQESDWQQALDDYVHARLSLERRPLLQARLQATHEFYAINEIAVVSRHRKLLTMSVSIGESRAFKMRAEGLLVATPTGSTGTSLAYGGAIVVPSAEVLMVSALAAFDFSARPIIVNNNAKIHIKFDNMPLISVLADGREYSVELASESEFSFELSSRAVLWAGVQDAHFYDALREKLGWFTLAAGVKKC